MTLKFLVLSISTDYCVTACINIDYQSTYLNASLLLSDLSLSLGPRDDSAFAVGSGIRFVFASSWFFSNRFRPAKCPWSVSVVLTSCMDVSLERFRVARRGKMAQSHG